MKLEDIGFYTLSDKRCQEASVSSRLYRGEILLTGRCNFNCPYCRHVGGKDLSFEQVKSTLIEWAKHNLYAVRFSGGEPTIWGKMFNGPIYGSRSLSQVIQLSRDLGVEKIAISTNGSADWDYYKYLLACGLNDISISLDACCAEDGDKMTGGVKGAWEKVVANIKALSIECYVTVGIVLTQQNLPRTADIIRFSADLGVSDIRIIPAAQDSNKLQIVEVSQEHLDKFPILRYRINNIKQNLPVRGLRDTNASRCGLVLDDIAVCGDNHYPCVIYPREGGEPIGKVGPNMRQERAEWYKNHNCQTDPICKNNCLDCLVLYNDKHRDFHPVD